MVCVDGGAGGMLRGVLPVCVVVVFVTAVMVVVVNLLSQAVSDKFVVDYTSFVICH